MGWGVHLDPECEGSLRGLDEQVARRILVTVSALAELEEPHTRCQGLGGPLVGLWRWRVGDDRVRVDICGGELVILALEVGHRRCICDD